MFVQQQVENKVKQKTEPVFQVEFDMASYRPFLACKTKEIEKHACDAARKGDIENLSYCLAELSPKHRTRAISTWMNVTEFAQTLGLEPIEWLDKAVETTRSFSTQSTGKHNLYIILLSKLRGKYPGYGLYVGETSKSPKVRYEEHALGKRNNKGPLFSRIVRNHHVCLLPTLYEHLNPLSKEEAKVLESNIAESLRQDEIPVYGGH